MKFDTKVIHSGGNLDPAFNAVTPPIYQTSTYKQQVPGDHKGFTYSRIHNPTRQYFENAVAELEGAKYALSYASGQAATDAVLRNLKTGDEVIIPTQLYGGTFRLISQLYNKAGIRFIEVDFNDIEALKKAITTNTRIIWIEAVSNPTLSVYDINLIKESIPSHVLLCVDNTFATPYLVQPISLGADIVMHSVTKYLAGHSDVIMGAVVTNSEEIYNNLFFAQHTAGAVPGPQDCFLALRGLRTLSLRMQRHCENASKVALFLSNQKEVEKVYYPGLPAHEGHDLACRQMKDFGGMVSFVIPAISRLEMNTFFRALKIFSLAESLGGIESLCSYPPTMSHASYSQEQREKMGISDGFVRLSVGIEDVEDLIEDLKQALGALS